MITSCEILNVSAEPVIALRQQINASDVRHCMGAGIAELRAALAAQGIGPTGPWLTMHFKVPDSTWDFSICEPVREGTAFKDQGRVAASALPAGKIARCVYVGGYEGLPTAWPEFLNWIKEKGEKAETVGFWEVYTINPDNKKDGEELRTELNCRLE